MKKASIRASHYHAGEIMGGQIKFNKIKRKSAEGKITAEE
jgi:hypothetical protein